MNGILKAIIISVTISSLFGCIILSLVPDGVMKEIAKFTVGLFIANALFTPITQIKFPSMESIFIKKDSKIQTEIENAKNQSNEMILEVSNQNLCDNIAENLKNQGYICDIKAELSLDKDNNINIDNIYIYSDIDDYPKISEFIQSNYQIAKENIKHVET